MNNKNTLSGFILQQLNSFKEQGLINKDAILDNKSSLYGEHGILNSLNLVLLIVHLEEFAGSEWGHEIVIADDKVFSQRTSPFSTVETLATYVDGLLSGPG